MRAERLEKGKITGLQLMAIIALSRLQATTIMMPVVTGSGAGRDVWLAVLLATAAAIPIALIVVELGLRHPGKTIVQYGMQLLGRPLGIGFAVGLAVFFLFIAGSKAIARMSLIVFAIFLFFKVPTVLLPWDRMDFGNLLPVMEHGPKRVLGATLSSFALYAEIIEVGMVIPYLSSSRDAKRYTLYGVLISGGFLLLQSVAIIAAFGTLADGLVIPQLSLARLISLANFIERVEVVTISVWSVMAWLKMALALWAATLALAQAFDLDDHKPLVYPAGFFAVALGVFFCKDFFELRRFLSPSVFGVSNTVAIAGSAVLLYVLSLLGRWRT